MLILFLYLQHHSRLSQSYSSPAANDNQGFRNPTFHDIKDKSITEFENESELSPEKVPADIDQTNLIMVDETLFESGNSGESDSEPTEYDDEKRWRRTVTFNWMKFSSNNDLDVMMLAD